MTVITTLKITRVVIYQTSAIGKGIEFQTMLSMITGQLKALNLPSDSNNLNRLLVKTLFLKVMTKFCSSVLILFFNFDIATTRH